MYEHRAARTFSVRTKPDPQFQRNFNRYLLFGVSKVTWSCENGTETSSWTPASISVLNPIQLLAQDIQFFDLLFFYLFSPKRIHSNLEVKSCSFEPESILFLSRCFSSFNCKQYRGMVAWHEYDYNFNEQIKIAVAIQTMLLMRIFTCYVFLQVLSLREKHKQPGTAVFRVFFVQYRTSASEH